MKFKSKMAGLALEDLKEDLSGMSVANEGWKGAGLGALAGLSSLFGLGGIVGAVASSETEKKKAQLEKLAKQVEIAAIDNGKAAVASGKLSKEDFDKHVKVGAKGIISGFILGSLFGPIYGAIKGSELEDLLEEMKAKGKELDTIVKAEAKRQGKAATESIDGEPEGETTSTDVAGGADPANPTAGAAAPATDGAEPGKGDAESTPTEGQTPPPAEGETPPPEGETPPAEGETTPPAEGEVPPPAEGADPAATDLPPADGAEPPAEGEVPPVEGGEAPAAAAATSEAEGTPAEPVEPVEGEEDPEADTIEVEMGEVDEIENKEAEAGEDVEKLNDAVESLEGLIAGLECAIETGGLNMAGSILARNNLNTVTKNLRVAQLSIPALEDMETPAARIGAASTLKDQVVAFVGRIIKAIKEAFVRFANWTVEVYKRLTNAYTALEARAAKLAEKVESSEMQTEKITNKNVVAGVTVGNRVIDDLGVYLNNLGLFAKYINDPDSYKVYLDAIDQCEAMIKDPAAEEEVRGKISELLKKWAEDMEKHTINITKLAHQQSEGTKGTGKAVANAQVFTLPLLGQQLITVVLPNSAEGIIQLNSTLTSNGAESVAESVDPLDKAEAKKICALVAQIAKSTRESAESNRGGVKELISEIKKRNDSITAMANKLQHEILEDVGAGEKTRKVIIFINNFFNSTPKLPVHAVNRALPRNLSVALDYVAASLGAKAEAAAPAAGAAAPKQIAA